MEKCESKPIFRSTTNVQTGKQEWMAVDEAYDYHQEIARSAYADMLHDSERNEKYHAALKHAIQLLKNRGEKVHVLDIGTGSGILAMMACKLGADTVAACEVFRPMHDCARKVLEINGFGGKIKLVPKRSTELTVGLGCDLEQRANVLIAEVFDTELIGEGAISTFNHAHRCLITADAIVIPSRATIYAQIVQSKVVRRWHQMFPLKISKAGFSLLSHNLASSSTTKSTTSGSTTPNLIVDSTTGNGLSSAGSPSEVIIQIPPEMDACSGTPSPHDLQLSQIPHSAFEVINEPMPVLHFDFSKPNQPTEAKSRRKFEAPTSCYADAVFFWWSLDMDPAGEIVLSCAPHWSQPDGKDVWRDHWLQAIFYPRTTKNFEAGEGILLEAAHDEYSVWFDISSANPPVEPENNNENSNGHTAILPKRNKIDHGGDGSDGSLYASLTRPLCTCLLHIALGRSRIGAWNDRYRVDKYTLALSQAISTNSPPICLCLGDGNPLSLLCAVMGAAKVFTVEPNSLCASVIERLIEFNNLQDRIKVLKKPVEELTEQDFDGYKPSLVVAEPEYSYTDGYYLPHLQSLTFWYALESIRSKQLLSADTVIIPSKARLKMLAMEFEDLWKIRAPVGRCTGFDLTPLDEIIQAALEHADPNIEPQPLWEYAGVALSEEQTLLTFDFSTPGRLVESTQTLSRHTSTTTAPPVTGDEMSLDCDNSLPKPCDAGQQNAISEGTLQFMCPGTCNGLAFWIEYTLGNSTKVSPLQVISDGTTEPISAGRKPRWSMYHRQGVHLFKNAERVTPARNQLRYSAKLCLTDGQMQFNANFESIEDDEGH